MDDMEKTMIRLIAVVFALAVATSALATPLAPLHQPDGQSCFKPLYYRPQSPAQQTLHPAPPVQSAFVLQ
jgi:hypothetical protein